MLTKASFQNAFENPDLAIVFEHIRDNYCGFCRLKFAQALESRGYLESSHRVFESIKDEKPTHDEICYARRVMETFSLDPEEYDLDGAFQDMRFFNHKKSGEAHGYVDFEGHRFTVARNPDSKGDEDRFMVKDLKSGNHAYASNPTEAKALAFRHMGNEHASPIVGAGPTRLPSNAKDQMNGPALI